MDRPTPRVNAAKMAEYSEGKIVRVLGKVASLEDDRAILETSDAGQITVNLIKDTNMRDTFVEVIGKIAGESTLTELVTQNMGDSLDLALADKVVELTHAYPNVYPTGE
ncbi:hypothetical protein Rhopal_003312-T1 [Rhodotorula paludigena]|uniref:Replication factor A protein 3 n=1 Tax=Rhodotorula paludigena TaxID=86838 RepID=A0AAV5GJ81_9BASI|nr:hypothetical protein Rhopal_003312-T1 [Rhodotorula paludigena]